MATETVPLAEERLFIDRRSFRLRDNYLLLNAIKTAYRDNTSIVAGITADPHSLYLRGNGKTSYALRVVAAWYKYKLGLDPVDAWLKALDSIVFSLDELREKLDNSTRDEIIIADDIGRWFSPKPQYTKEERKIFEILETFRLNSVALVWTAVTPRSVPGKILIHSDYLVYVSKINKNISKAEIWQAVIKKDKPWDEPIMRYLASESFPTKYPDLIHNRYNSIRREKFRYSDG